jgi:hypothetical protein
MLHHRFALVFFLAFFLEIVAIEKVAAFQSSHLCDFATRASRAPLQVPVVAKKRMSASSDSSGDNGNDVDNDNDKLTILGFGSLLSERSSRMTFPDLENFRLGRIPNYRRVFGHVTSIFFKRGIANKETQEMSSLSAEYCEGLPGFVCAVFEVSNAGMMEHGIPSQAFLEREEEFHIIPVPFVDLTTGGNQPSQGILCTRGSDEEFLKRWGQEHFDKDYAQYGIQTIWNWDETSGLKPCAIYLRHCTLAAQKMGEECYNSFLDETFLVDRKTTIRSYLKDNPHVMTTPPPHDLEIRYGG